MDYFNEVFISCRMSRAIFQVGVTMMTCAGSEKQLSMQPFQHHKEVNQ